MSKDIDKINQQIDSLKRTKNPEEQLDQGDVVFEDSDVIDTTIKKDETKKVYKIEDLVAKEMNQNQEKTEKNISSISKNYSKNDNFIIYYVIILLLVVIIIVLSILILR